MASPIQCLPLSRRPDPFSHPDWIFEVKHDGFRALAQVDSAGARLISRNGNHFASFDPLCQAVSFFLSVKSAVLDGEIVCLDEHGCSQFNHLLFRRGDPMFCAFDLLSLKGRDLRGEPLIERKRRLRDILPECSQLLFVDHVEARGEELFELICQRDLEGIVAKHRLSRYKVENGNPPWIKIKSWAQLPAGVQEFEEGGVRSGMNMQSARGLGDRQQRQRRTRKTERDFRHKRSN